ncbi:hypothetical protein JHN63_25385 [Streptomyces sp. MBT65]|uniref:hypothetical protein n=1 Tax=Streptomyces sp. MBT65 TaxID=1488395 RepID=UPI00190BA2B1|nr:hypothetical protein [Streptomyces sp. MBT65]MBK3577074.1 hypothetical protein [Streptomyces sp. MBT65]
MPKGRRRAVVGYAALTLLGVTATAAAVSMSIASLDLSGNAVEVRFAECHQESVKGGTKTVCSGPVQHTTHARTASVTYKGHVGETVRAAPTLWGSYEPVKTDFVSWGIWILVPVLPLFGTAGAGALTVREFRRARQPAAADEAS